MYKVPIEESQCFEEKIQVVSWRGKGGEKKKEKKKRVEKDLQFSF